MNKILLLSIATFTFTWAQFDDIPYDWGGQYGVISNNGEVIWNQDWQVGVLLLDGTFSSYPTRFGSFYRNNFVIRNNTDFYDQFHTIPDSSNISSKANYYRGDFSYDQLEVDFTFEEKNRIIVLNGFKRKYSGPYGQYLNDNESTNPLQQSYRLDYSSKNDSELLSLSAGCFFTDNRLNLNDPADFTHIERTTAVGLGYLRKFELWNYNLHAAVNQQFYNMRYDSTQYYKVDSTKAYLNRIHLNQFVQRKLNKSSLLKIGIELDNQAVATDDNIRRNWSTIYGGWENNVTKMRFGATLASKEYVPYIKILNQINLGDLGSINSNIFYSAKPKHIFNYVEGDDQFEKWFVTDINGDFNLYNFPLTINLHFANTNSDLIYRYYENSNSIDVSENLISSTFSTILPLIRTWKLDLYYRHIFEHNVFSDGIGDRVKIGLNISEKLFKKNMHANLHVWANGYFDHNPNLGFEGFHFGPYVTDDTSLSIPDYWNFNLNFSIKVSKLTFGWKVNNLLKTVESITNQILPDLNENYLLITNSNDFPPMNRFVTFNIIWEFDN